MDQNDQQSSYKANPFDASPISKFLFLWLVPLLRKGTKRELKFEDLNNVLLEDDARKLGDVFERKWKDEVCQCPNPKLWQVMRSFMWRKYTLIFLAYLLNEMVMGLMQSFLLKKFIKSFSSSGTDEDEDNNRFRLATVLVSVTVLQLIIYTNLITLSLHLGLKVRVGVSSLIFRKILRLRTSDSTNVGKLCNFLTSDVATFDRVFKFILSFLLAPIKLVVYSLVLFYMGMGTSTLGCLIAILFIFPFQLLFTRFSFYFRKRIAKRSDIRARFLHEIIRGVRLIKMYTWENAFTEVVKEHRTSEIEFVGRGLYLRGIYMCVNEFAGKFVPFCALLASVVYATEGELKAENVFFAMPMLGAMKSCLNQISYGFSHVAEMLASMDRFDEFLLTDERKCEFLEPSPKENDDIEPEPSVVMQNYSASWNNDRETLHNLSINLKGNQLVIVAGYVGSGKSSFLNAILSELPITKGSCRVQGRVTYASQEPWIFPGTIRENILFGLEMDMKRYWKIIELCCLDADLKQFPEEDFTLVDDHSLSGGQKARINLARALYQEANVYLFDDPLSAVDLKVNRLLFTKCIKEFLDGSLRILVTHQLQYFPIADYIIVLNREGEIWYQGTYSELKGSNVDLSSLMTNSGDFATRTSKPEQEALEQLERTDENDLKANGKDPSSPTLRNRGSNKSRNHETKARISSKSEIAKPVPTPKQRKYFGSIYYKYFESGGSLMSIVFLLFTFLATNGVMMSLDYFLSLWTNAIAEEVNENEEHHHQQQNRSNLNIYSALILLFLVVMFIRCVFFFRHCMKVSINLHERMISSVIHAPVRFFDKNSSGRIMSRFTSDLNQIDDGLPVALYDFISTVLRVLGVLILNVIANPYVIVPAILLLICVWQVTQFYLASAGSLKRLEAKAKSPMLTHVTTTMQGLTTIRALKAEDRIIREFERIQNQHSSISYISITSNSWFSITLEMLTCAYLACVCYGFLLISSQSGSVGVAISSVLTIAPIFQWGIRKSVETEKLMTSVERAFEYCTLQQEAPLKMPDESVLITQNWPEFGRIEFDNVSLSYDDLHENKVLKNVSFCIKPGEKVGICGRTGAGKSSLISSLFRLTETCEGVIRIDDVPVHQVGLHTLRSKISIIPQDPVLFTGSIRYNLDPLKEFKDDDLLRVLEEVDLHRVIESLDCPVTEGGSNFSLGQRQLLCLARALLRRNNILILDEPTANVDPATDQLVQNTIRRKFAHCTVITIAHRLQTVEDNDRVLLVDNGEVHENA